VDELGTAISGVDLLFAHGGSRDDGTTDGNGVARLEDSAATSAKAKIVTAKALRKAVKPRWDQPRGDRKWLDESQGVTVVRLVGDNLPSFDLVTEKVRIVSIQPYVARVRLIGGFFDTSKCFILPRGLDAVRAAVKMYDESPKAKVLAVGHTDTAGKPAYNDPLSFERAEAVKDYLTDNIDGWYHWYEKGVPADKRWSSKEDSLMIGALPDAADRDPAEDQVRWFQRTRGLEVDGIAGSQTRHALIREYMQLDGTSLPKGIEVVPHGCGENFPAKPTTDSEDTEENRRVELFFFDGELGPQPPPSGKNSAPGATDYPEWVRRTQRTEDHVIVPGQAIFRLRRLEDDKPIAGAVARIEFPGGLVAEHTADDQGVVRLDGVTGEQFRLLDVIEPSERMMITSIGEPTPSATSTGLNPGKTLWDLYGAPPPHRWRSRLRKQKSTTTTRINRSGIGSTTRRAPPKSTRSRPSREEPGPKGCSCPCVPASRSKVSPSK
jgi:outer membrane protein OmpA-like peptidoglycan-associated protein